MVQQIIDRAGRKFVAFLIALILLVAGFLLSYIHSLGEHFNAFVGGLGALLASFMGANLIADSNERDGMVNNEIKKG